MLCSLLAADAFPPLVGITSACACVCQFMHACVCVVNRVIQREACEAFGICILLNREGWGMRETVGGMGEERGRG